ncbi:MAG: transposase [Fimbriiglobus sp.]
MMPPAFDQFLKAKPLTVLARVTLQTLFDPARLDQLFDKHAKAQHTRELLFSHLVDLLQSVILGTKTSLHKAFQDRLEEGVLSVSAQAVYGKLRRIDLSVAEALVQDSAELIAPAMSVLNADRCDPLPGYCVRVIDGNLLTATERRLKPLRKNWAKGLPGRVLAVYEPGRDLVTHAFLEPDGHACERSRMEDVFQLAKPSDVWLADANFCTQDHLRRWQQLQTHFVVRHHSNVRGKSLGNPVKCGDAENGEVWESDLELQDFPGKRKLRRITLKLTESTRDGTKEIHVLTNLPPEVSGVAIAELYRTRWTIEGRFYEMSQTLNAEPKSLCCPGAALLAFCLGLVTSNGWSLIRAGLRSCHGSEAVESMSRFRMSEELKETYAGMMVVLPYGVWEEYLKKWSGRLGELIRELASQVRVGSYRKTGRGPKKPRTGKVSHKPGANYSTQREINKQKSNV